MTNEFVLGIDLGTSAVKVLLAPVQAGPSAPQSRVATAEFEVSIPRPGWSEQSPDAWWHGIRDAIRTLFASGGISPAQVAALAVSGQMHGAVLLDAHGEVVRPCILWNDQRSAAQCDWITDTLGLPTLLEWVANPALAGFTAPKLLWVREHEPEAFARTSKVLLPKDYINFRLTGEQYTEFSDASGTLLFDVSRRRWSDDMLSALSIPLDMLPTATSSTAVIGHITPDAAAETGLAAGTPVVAGGADNACAAVAAGVVSPSSTLTSLGTSGTVLAPTSAPHGDPLGRLHMFCHAVADTWYHMGVVLSAGTSVRWFRDNMAPDLRDQALQQGQGSYELLGHSAASVEAGSNGLIFLPYLTGERTPHGDPFARGVFIGLSPAHTRDHMFRSVLEGVTFALADSLDLIRALGIDTLDIRVTGGGAGNPLWRQILADVFHSPIRVVGAAAGPAWGAAILAGVGIGLFPSAAHAAESRMETSDLVEPADDAVEIYRRYHNEFDRLYTALREEFRILAQVRLASTKA